VARQPAASTRVLTVAAVAVAAVAGWLGWLGWHEQKHQVPGSTAVEGPYAPWQVVALALTLALAVAVAAWLGIGTYAVLTASVATTVMFSVDASSQPTIGANMWPAGAVFLLVGALLGLGVVALLVGGVRLATARYVAR
jgi:hypothetical protein